MTAVTGRADSTASGLRGGPRPGLLLGDRYRLEELLAVGGMGAVWRATDQLLGRPVAVKLLRPELAADPAFLARFRAEARHAAAVQHPGVAAVHDYGEEGATDREGAARTEGAERNGDEGAERSGDEGAERSGVFAPGHPDDTVVDHVVDLREGRSTTPTPRAGDAAGPVGAWLVMDLVAGEPLSAVLAREGRLGVVRTLRVVAGVADALAAAHAVGVVHRDVKPGNLLLTTDHVGEQSGEQSGDQAERVVVTDFGIARAAGAASLTRTGTLVGTAAYLSPEQAAGRVATAASDLYALGVVAYECLAGRKPFAGATDLAVALAHSRDPVPPLPADVPAPVRTLVLRLLAKDPQQRPATAAAVAGRARLLAADPTTDVPLAAGPVPAPTAVLPAPAATALVLDDRAPGGRRPASDAASRRSGRRPLLLGLAAGGTLLLGGLLVGALLGAARSPAPARTPDRPATSATPAPSLRLDAADYVGRPADQVRADLTRLGLAVRLVGTAGDGPVGTVAALDPTGVVARGTTITLRVVEQVPQSGPAHPGSKHDPKDEHAKKSGTRPGEGDRKGEG